MQITTGVNTTNEITEQEALEIGIEAYRYFYPLVLMDVTRRQMTNAESGRMPGFAPMNAFGHMRGLPTEFRAVPRPNFDTLYSPAEVGARPQAGAQIRSARQAHRRPGRTCPSDEGKRRNRCDHLPDARDRPNHPLPLPRGKRRGLTDVPVRGSDNRPPDEPTRRARR
jgi:hypothetical protein